MGTILSKFWGIAPLPLYKRRWRGPSQPVGVSATSFLRLCMSLLTIIVIKHSQEVRFYFVCSRYVDYYILLVVAAGMLLLQFVTRFTVERFGYNNNNNDDNNNCAYFTSVAAACRFVIV